MEKGVGEPRNGTSDARPQHHTHFCFPYFCWLLFNIICYHPSRSGGGLPTSNDDAPRRILLLATPPTMKEIGDKGKWMSVAPPLASLARPLSRSSDRYHRFDDGERGPDVMTRHPPSFTPNGAFLERVMGSCISPFSCGLVALATVWIPILLLRSYAS